MAEFETFSNYELINNEIDVKHLEEIIKKFHKNGYLILKDIFPAIKITKLNNYFIKQYERYFVEKSHHDALTVGNKRYHITIEIKDIFNDINLYANPIISPIIEKILGKKFVIEDINCVISLPGSKVMPTHRDGIIFPGLPIANLLPTHAVGLLIPLIPFTNLTGPTRFWPGSHKTHLSPEGSINVPFEAPEIDLGTAIIMDYRLLHSGSPNHSNLIRPLFYINYSVNWYFDSNNFKKQAHFILDDENFKLIPDEFKTLFERRNLKLSGSKI